MKAVFLDRDGVINQKPPGDGYIAHWGEIRYTADVFSSVAALHQAGFKVFIATNQRGIALGKTRPADLEDIHRRMREEFARHGVLIAGIYVCPHGIADHCSCRKPKPGLLLGAAAEHGLDLSSSWMIGDSERDVEAGKRAGCRTVRILLPGSIEQQDHKADICSTNLASAARRILQLSQIETPSANA